MGVTFVEIVGSVTGELALPPEDHRVDFYLKFLLDPSGKGFDADPSLVYCHRDEITRKVEGVAGEVVLRESRFDPVVDLPVADRARRSSWASAAPSSGARSSPQLPGDQIMPFVHQRYDDLSVTGGD